MDKKLIRIIDPGVLIYFIIMLLFTAAGFWYDFRLGSAELFLVVAALVYTIFARNKRKSSLYKYMETSLLNADTLSSRSMLSFPLPMTVLKLQSGDIVWCNEHFKELTGSHSTVFGMRISEIVPGFELQWISDGYDTCPYDINIAGKLFTVTGTVFQDHADSPVSESMAVLFWEDKTEAISLRKSIDDKNVICAEIVFDNYDEAINNLSDSRRSAILASLEKHLSDWSSPAEGIVRKTDRDRYLFIFEEKYLKSLIDGKFSVMEALKNDPVTAEVSSTLSIGIGREGETLRENMKNARLALDMALSRGGDQAVVRSRLNFDFYGGRGGEYTKRTKVKSRLMANALGSLMKDSDKVYVMGHRYADNDSLGAAVGIVCAARKYGKQAKIIIDVDDNNAGPMLAMLRKNDEYISSFISDEEAMIESSSGSLLIIVDTNRPMYVESISVLESFNNVAVIDHHRRAADYIDNAALNVHEPSSSSTCEIVVELLQYMVNPNEILKCEAVALLAGITLDTKSFTLKTGVRTFDAASFLRRIGADTVEVKHLFQNDFESYLKRGDLIRHTVFYEQMFAIVKSPDPVDSTVAAQAADELLSVSGIRASFVIFPSANQAWISARSLGEINVQLILERLGGGGHLTTAGCQIPGVTVDKAYTALTEAIDNYIAQT